MQSKLAEGNADVLQDSENDVARSTDLTPDLATQNEQLRRDAEQLRASIAASKEERRRLRRIVKESPYRQVSIVASKPLHRPASSKRVLVARKPDTISVPAIDWEEGQQVAVVCLPKNIPLTFAKLCELIRDGFLADAEKVKRRQARAAAPYAGDSLFTQRGLPDPSRR